MIHIQKESGRIDQSKSMNITDIFDVFVGTSAGALNVGDILIPGNSEKANLPEIKVKPLYSTEELRSNLPEILSAHFHRLPLEK